ncbi:MAG: putative SbcD/Mre11-related phosphoesterase [Natronomonas sp.]|jgi:putative SbcD/Mre11-related phosphoesterase|uniref:metallophosphoesterase n=1 Tax=Natronomonas sp. TaxID=2184060 RepID=UPI00398980CC
MEFEPWDRAVYLPAADALACADLHVGRDATSEVALPLGEATAMADRFEALLDRYDPTEAVIAGDLLHSFDRLPTGVAETTRRLQDLADAVDCRLVVTPGNHDPLLEELWNDSLEPEHRLGDTEIVVTHGHAPPKTDAEWYVVGHDHPTIEIEGVRRPCYLYGTQQYVDAGVLMLPSFSRLPAGVAINEMRASDFQSPLIRDANALRPIVRDDDAGEPHEFPPLGEFRRLL